MWKETLKNSSIVLSGVVLSRFFVFLYNLLIIRQLSIGDYALFTFALVVFNWVLVFSHLDLYAAVSKHVSEFRAREQGGQAQSFYQHAKLLALCFSCFGIVGAFLIASRHAYHSPVLLLFLASLFPLALMTVNDGYLKGFEKFSQSACVEIVNGFSKFGVLGLALLAIGSFDLDLVLLLFLFSAVLTYLFSWFAVRKSCPPGRVKFSYQGTAVKKLFNYSKWVCVTDLMSAGILLSSNLIISSQNAEDLAYFNLVVLLYSVFQIGFGSITTVLIPQVSRMLANQQKLRLLGAREFLFLSTFALVVIAALVAFPYQQELARLLFDKQEYADSFSLLAILVISFPFRAMTVTNKGVMQGMGRPGVIALVSTATLLAHVLLFIPLYFSFGLTGALFAIVGAYLVEFILTRQIARKAIGQSLVPLPVSIESQSC